MDNENDSDDYDPHEHRNVENPTTDIEALMLLIKGIFGIGILAMPDAFKHTGWITGIIGSILLGSLATYCFHMLIRSQFILCKRVRVPMLTYPETMELAFQQGPNGLRWLSKPAKWIVDLFLISYQLSVCCGYVVFTAENVRRIADLYWKRIDLRLYIAMLIVPFILIFMVNNLKYLAIFSQFANILMIVGVGMLYYFICQDLPPLSKQKKFAAIKDVPLFFGTALFAMTSVGTSLSIENNMKNPKHFRGTFGIFNIGMLFTIILFTITGFFGYWKYGCKILGSISLNTPNDEILAQIINSLFSVSVFITYALQGYVAVEIIMNKLKTNYPNTKCLIGWDYLVRFSIIVLTFGFAALIPRLGFIIALIGVFCETILTILFPALIELCILYPDKYGKCNYILLKCFFLIAVGVIGFTAGLYTCVLCFVRSITVAPTTPDARTCPSCS